MTWTIDILGVPAPQGSKTAVVRGNRAVLIEGASKAGRAAHRAWRQTVAADTLEAVGQFGPCPDGPLSVSVRFVMPKPKSRPKRARWCDRKPDLDKLVRSTLDGLADGGLLAHGDSRVARLYVSKVYVVPGQGTGARVRVDVLKDEFLAIESGVSA